MSRFNLKTMKTKTKKLKPKQKFLTSLYLFMEDCESCLNNVTVKYQGTAYSLKK